jgi:hypothetical protein
MENPFNSENYKLGLALSGGGFRASLFHIGVLGKMGSDPHNPRGFVEGGFNCPGGAR